MVRRIVALRDYAFQTTPRTFGKESYAILNGARTKKINAVTRYYVGEHNSSLAQRKIHQISASDA